MTEELDPISNSGELCGNDEEEVPKREEVQHNFSHAPVSMIRDGGTEGEGAESSDGDTDNEYELEEDIFNPNRNKLHIPPYTVPEVRVAQFIALFISLITSNDVVSSLDAFLVEYDSNVSVANKGATYPKWILSHICRFVEGAFGIVVAFFFIVQATDVLGLFLDFLAVQFVSELDNAGFYLASKGYMPCSNIKEATEKIGDIKMKQGMDYVHEPEAKKQARKFKRRIQLGVFYVILAVLYVLCAWVWIYQDGGTYFKMECERFQINLPDFEYRFFHKCNSTEDDKCPEGWDSRTTALKYPDFNGLYVAEMEDNGKISRHDKFPVYRQRLAGDSSFGDNSPAGEIYYCKSEEAWVFRVQNVSKGADAEDCSWLLKSPATHAETLNDVPEEDWMVWTGTIDEGKVDITCVECLNTDLAENQKYHIGCNFHGVCDEGGTCRCQEGFVGVQCSTCADCSVLDIEHDVRGTAGFELKWKWPGAFHRLDYPNGTAFELYDRPVYYYMKGEDIGIGAPAPLVVFFYWADQYALWDFSDRVSCRAGISCSTNQQRDELRKFLEAFHPLWDYLEDKMKPEYVSEQTNARSGMKGLKWRAYDDFLKNSDFSIGNFSELNFRCERYEYGDICGN